MSYLIIDIGSSSVRTLLFHDDATPIDGAMCSRSHDFQTNQDGRATASATTLREHVEACIDEILGHEHAHSIRGVGMATFVGNWLGLDATGAPITDLMTYADTRSHSEIEQLRDKLDGQTDAYHQAVGCMLHTAYLPAQFSYFLRTQPETAQHVRHVTDIGGYLYRQWFGRDIPMSYTVAGWTGLLHTAEHQWHTDYIQQFECNILLDALPSLANYDTVQTGLMPTYADRWAMLKDVPFFLAMGDGAVANVGSGAVDAGHMALTIGTTSALRVVKPVDTIPTGLWRYLVQRNMPLVGGATSEGGNIYQWVVEQLGLASNELEAYLQSCIPNSHGLTVLPLIAGERSPGWHPDASGTLHGIRRSTSRLDILQAELEAVAIRLSIIFDMLKDEHTVIMAGGGAIQSSPAWTQMLANAFNTPIQCLAEPEITARGVALMLRNHLDGIALDATPPKIKTVVEPQAEHVPLFQSARAQQQDLYRRLYAD